MASFLILLFCDISKLNFCFQLYISDLDGV
jgi:hypothetical protein